MMASKKPANRSSAAKPSRLSVAKTYKLFIGGKFPRSESGRSTEVTSTITGEPVANVAWASRKDTRNAVVAARGAVGSWSAATAYNRGQVLYRIAEMLEGRRAQFEDELMQRGLTATQATAELDATIDTWVYYAGWSDKYPQVMGSINPVAGPFLNISMPEPTGVVAIISPKKPSLLGIAQTLAPAIVAGNTAVIVASEDNPLVAMTFAEVIATSDVPGGVVNILTGHPKELAPILAGHMDVNAMDMRGATPALRREITELGIENLKRIFVSAEPDGLGSISAIEAVTETKTVWHPVGV